LSVFSHLRNRTANWTTPMRRVVMIAAFALGLGSLVGALLLAPLQRRMIYFPSRTLRPIANVVPGAQEVSFVTNDEVELEGWFLPPAVEESTVTIVVFNGNGGNRSDRGSLARGFASHGYGVLLFDYRGYGTNDGHPSEEGLEADAQAAVAYLRTRADVDSERIVYFGESLGAALAIATAVQDPPAALILRSPFTSLPDVASAHIPFLPMTFLLRDHYLNEEAIRDLDVPTLVIAGSGDRTVPLEQSERVFQAAGGTKSIVVIPGADHNDAQLASGPQMLDPVVEFITEVLPELS
jgi:fermentation-respiration switch protein FrsA (DUF1100 family)